MDVLQMGSLFSAYLLMGRGNIYTEDTSPAPALYDRIDVNAPSGKTGGLNDEYDLSTMASTCDDINMYQARRGHPLRTDLSRDTFQ